MCTFTWKSVCSTEKVYGQHPDLKRLTPARFKHRTFSLVILSDSRNFILRPPQFFYYWLLNAHKLNHCINFGCFSLLLFYRSKIINLLCTFLTQKCCPLKYCQAHSQLQVKLSLNTELALISVNPAPPTPHLGKFIFQHLSVNVDQVRS